MKEKRTKDERIKQKWETKLKEGSKGGKRRGGKEKVN